MDTTIQGCLLTSLRVAQADKNQPTCDDVLGFEERCGLEIPSSLLSSPEPLVIGFRCKRNAQAQLNLPSSSNVCGYKNSSRIEHFLPYNQNLRTKTRVPFSAIYLYTDWYLSTLCLNCKS